MALAENDLKVPESLSKEFFEKVLKHGLKLDNVQIDDLQISLGSAVGDNYTSTIYRALVKYCTESNNSASADDISLIVKKVHLRSVLDESGFDVDPVEREVKMYTEIMPKIEKLYNEENTFAPKCFYAEQTSTHECIVFQDLNALGYLLADRVKRLDEAHSKIVLQKLGRYHAGVMVLSAKQPHIFEHFDKGFHTAPFVDTDIFQKFYVESFIQVTELISTWNGFEEIAEKLKKLNYREKIANEFTPKPNEIRLLNHSDCWVNNMMFTYANEKVTDVIFIDLQVSQNESLGMDVNYFLNTSVDYDLLRTKREELLGHYYEAFRQGLEELHYPNIPSWEAVRNEINEKEFYGFVTLTAVAPITSLDRESSKDSTLDTILDKDALQAKLAIAYSSPKYEAFLKYSLKRFDKLGLFD